MKQIPDGSVDMILCDLPYGTTACKWDTIIPFDKLWEQYNRIIKDNGAIVLFGSEPFSSALRISNIKHYKYDWVWDKGRGTNFQTAKRIPMKSHECISVFYKKTPKYNPQYWFSTPYATKERRRSKKIEMLGVSSAASICTATISQDGKRYPLSIISFKRDSNRLHPTQKPLALCEYLIKTYTQENDLVLDNCMGSGTTGVACKNLNRKFIGIELDEEYFKTAENRIKGSLL
jgi:site-specific DNA-methyltransferase (adenine-specific)